MGKSKEKVNIFVIKNQLDFLKYCSMIGKGVTQGIAGPE